MVCENYAFHVEYTLVMRKHTANFNLRAAPSPGVENIQGEFLPVVQAAEHWQETLITEATSKLLLHEAFVEGAMNIPNYNAKPAHDYYFNPVHEEFAPSTMWSRNNAFSSAAKALEFIALQGTAHGIGQFFQARGL
jgi:hypothetical protein